MERSEDPNERVYGVLYEVATSDQPALDKAEGVGFGYDAASLEVTLDGSLLMASVYYATDPDSTLKPYTWYKALVVAGAEQHSLPKSYSEELKRAAATEDANVDRHDKHMQIVNGALGAKR